MANFVHVKVEYPYSFIYCRRIRIRIQHFQKILDPDQDVQNGKFSNLVKNSLVFFFQNY
jgi:hypothetical protein